MLFSTRISTALGALIVLTLAALPLSAAQAFEGSLLGSVNFNSASFNPGNISPPGNSSSFPIKGTIGFGGAFLIGGGGIGIDIETGLMIVDQIASATLTSLNNDSLNITQTYLDVPLMLVFRPFPFLSVRGGAYYGFGLGQSYTDSAGLLNPATFSGGVTNDYGVLAGAGITWPVHPRTEVRFDVMYQYGLATLNANSSPQDQTRLLSLWAGVTYRPDFMGQGEERHRGWGYGGGFFGWEGGGDRHEERHEDRRAEKRDDRRDERH